MRRLVSFKYRGVEVRDVQTPESLHMVDNDRLDAFGVPEGGGGGGEGGGGEGGGGARGGGGGAEGGANGANT